MSNYPADNGVGDVWGMLSEFTGKTGTFYTSEDANQYFFGFPQISSAANWGYNKTLEFSYVCPMVNEAGSQVIWFGVKYPVTNWWMKALKVWNEQLTPVEKRLLAREIYNRGGDTQHIRYFLDPDAQNNTYNRPAEITESYKQPQETIESKIIREKTERNPPYTPPPPHVYPTVDATGPVAPAPKKKRWYEELFDKLRSK